uniref:Thioredoxin domain-containing protein n=1 Tax=Steinernema glaseri TaxID=37863 RepID=A0A1I7Z5L6_9BILA
MPLLLGSVFPEFSAETNVGQISSFHEWIGNSWAILFSHPNDFTPVCTTELARAAQLNEEFKKRDVKLIALSCDSAESHRQWIPDIVEYCKQDKAAKGYGDGDEETKCCSGSSAGFPFPIIADEDRVLANKLEMLDPEEKDASGAPVTARAVFVIDPSKRMKLKILYPATTGRNFE